MPPPTGSQDSAWKENVSATSSDPEAERRAPTPCPGSLLADWDEDSGLLEVAGFYSVLETTSDTA